jgi:hypothetical protein
MDAAENEILVEGKVAIKDRLKSAIPTKTIEVEALPDAFLVSDEAWDELVTGLSTTERERACLPNYVLQFNGVRVLKKSCVVDLE